MAKNNSYIQMMVGQNGDNWISTLRPEDIQRSTKRIVKDMVRGNVDYQNHGKYFLDPKFLENLIIGVSNELEINTFNYQGCSLLALQYPQPNLPAHVEHLRKYCEIYGTIYNYLSNVKMTGNIGCLTDITMIYFNDRHHLN